MTTPELQATDLGQEHTECGRVKKKKHFLLTPNPPSNLGQLHLLFV